MDYQQGIGPWDYTISVVVWGGTGHMWGVNQGTTPTITTVKHLYFTQCCPTPSLPLANLGRWMRGHSLLGVYIESRLILFYMLLSYCWETNHKQFLNQKEKKKK